MEPQAFAESWDEFFASVRRARGRAAARHRDGELTLAQYQLLAVFNREEELPVGEVALAGGVAKPTATRMLSGLERDGIVERHQSDEDGRVVLVRPTAAGRRLLRAKRKLIEEKQRAIFESLTPYERDRAAWILRRLAVAVEDL